MSGADHREQEAKFQVNPPLLSALLDQPNLPQGYTSQLLGTFIHTDSYLDTEAYNLLRNGLALRVRQNGAAYEVGVKSLQASRRGAVQERLDVAFPLFNSRQPFDVESWPTAVQDQLDDYSIDLDELEELGPLIVVRQERQKSHIFSASDTTQKPLAEWSVDKVWISSRPTKDATREHINGNHTNEDAPAADFYELEIELLNPEETDAFSALVEQVQEQFGLIPTYKSKLVRGLALHIAQLHKSTNTLTPEMELAEGCRLLLHQQLVNILLNEHDVRMGEDPKSVRNMRVATRRARAALRLFGDSFYPGVLKPYQKGIKKLGRALGVVRDIDVSLANLRHFRRTQAKEQQKQLKSLRSNLEDQRVQAHAHLLTLLDSKQYATFIADFDAFCTKPTSDDVRVSKKDEERLPTQVRHTLPSIILRSFEAVRAYEVALTQDPLPPIETFHALRIQGKYLRYGLEFTQHLLGEQGTTLITQLKQIQDHLGELNDADVEQELLRHWIDQVDERDPFDERLAEIAKLIDELTATFPPRFADFISPENRQLLTSALACI
jgi:CHAD domain-containing protein